MKNMKVNRYGIFFLLCLLFLTGCKKGEHYSVERPSVKVPGYVGAVMDTRTVNRGNLVDERSMIFRYKASKVSELKFQIAQVEIAGIYVQPGDKVKKGELLAELNMEYIEEERKAVEEEIRKSELEIRHLENLCDIESDETLCKDYAGKIDYLKEAMEISLLRVKELKEQEEKGKIYADRDGIVTRVADDEMQGISDTINPVVVLENENKYFTGTFEGDVSLKKGDRIELFQGEKVVMVEVVSVKKKEETTTVKAVPISTAEAEIEFATYTWENGILENVLYVHEDAVIHTVEGKDVAYVMQKEGNWIVTEVSCGEAVAGMIPVYEGLEEGWELAVISD